MRTCLVNQALSAAFNKDLGTSERCQPDWPWPRDLVLLASGILIFCYGARFLLFGAMATPPSKLHFSTVIHYFSTFVQQHPGYLYAHLLFIVLAGVLWPLQIWGKFRSQNYQRHRMIGRFALLSMVLAMVTVFRYALFHSAGDSLAEKVTGLGFAAQIATVLYNAMIGFMAARRRNIVMHRRCMIRMVGLAYGVLPFKQLFAAFPPLNYLPGQSTYAAAVWLSSPVGMFLTE
ncbi:g5456 [Coccomyxa elongata]